MRDIKFRAWNKEEKRMNEVYFDSKIKEFLIIFNIILFFTLILGFLIKISTNNKDNNKVYPCSEYKEYSIINVPVHCLKELTQ